MEFRDWVIKGSCSCLQAVILNWRKLQSMLEVRLESKKNELAKLEVFHNVRCSHFRYH